MKNIIIIGHPGSGKTILMKRLSDVFKEFNPQGFLTVEMKEAGVITGLAVLNLNGESKVLSHASLKLKNPIGKGKLDIKGFETFLAQTFSKDKKTGLYFIDEIGKVECQSKKFCKLIHDLLSSERPFIASMADKGASFIQEIKKRDDIRLVEITPENRELLLKELTMEIRDLLLE